MLNGLYALARPGIFRMPPEDAHEATLRALEMGLHPRAPGHDEDQVISTNIAGLRFPNPVAVAAGFDKDARVPNALIGMGCGFAEIGTVTPKPQPGNPAPRVFRLIEDEGLINRLGFNNGGHAAVLARLHNRARGSIVGVNIGANKDASDRIADYVQGIETFAPVASYFMINISSPNTPGLRDLQAPDALADLLRRVLAARDAANVRRPLYVKIAPDIVETDIAGIAQTLLDHGVDAIAVSNTTVGRPGLRSPIASEAGGLSGKPLFEKSTIVLARVFQATGGRIPLIGIGGIDSGAAAVAKVRAGASLLQLYTGLIYRGPGLISEIKQALASAVRSANVSALSELTGVDAEAWARKPLG